jgi:hypothetical protein
MVKVAEYFVKHMNSHITEPYRDKCHLLQLHNVLGVWQQAAASNTSCAHHQIEFQTVPGDAIWRATTCLYENTTRATFPILSIKRVTSFERDKVCGLPKPENEVLLLLSSFRASLTHELLSIACADKPHPLAEECSKYIHCIISANR